MKEEGLIDGAVGVAKGRDELHPLPFYARSEDEIRRLAGMRHCTVNHIHVLERVKEKVAFVGLPCHTNAVRKMQKSNVRSLRGC
jgi:coenzyme F420-reducing hydrogenase beta subunit